MIFVILAAATDSPAPVCLPLSALVMGGAASAQGLAQLKGTGFGCPFEGVVGDIEGRLGRID